MNITKIFAQMQEFEVPAVAPVGRRKANDAAKIDGIFRNLELTKFVIERVRF